MDEIQKSKEWQHAFVEVTFHLLNLNPITPEEEILDLCELNTHIQLTIFVGQGYIFETPTEFFFYLSLIEEKIQEMKKKVFG